MSGRWMAGAGKRRFNRTEKPRAGKKELAKWEAIKERPAWQPDLWNTGRPVDRVGRLSVMPGFKGSGRRIPPRFSPSAPTPSVGEFPAEFQAPLPDRLIGDRDAASRQHLLNHAQAQREPEIEPDRVTDQLRRVAMASINRVSGRRHLGQISDRLGPAKPDAPQLDGAPIKP